MFKYPFSSWNGSPVYHGAPYTLLTLPFPFPPDKDGKLDAFRNFMAGMGAGVAEAIIIVAPVETVKTKCIELNMPFIKGMQHILSTEGRCRTHFLWWSSMHLFDCSC